MTNKYLEKIAFINIKSISNSIKNTVHVLKGNNITAASKASASSEKSLNRAKDNMHFNNSYLNSVLKNKGDMDEFLRAEKIYNSSMKHASDINRKHKANLGKLEEATKKTSQYRKNLAIGVAGTAVGGVGAYTVSSFKNSPPKFKV